MISIESRYLAGGTGRPIVLLGHSLGGDLAMQIAEGLDARDIPVDLVVTFDLTNDGPVTDNVRKIINLHTGGGDLWKIVRAPAGFPGELVNIDVTRRADLVAQELNHFNIDKAAVLHEEVIDEILDVFRRVDTVARGLAPAPASKPL